MACLVKVYLFVASVVCLALDIDNRVEAVCSNNAASSCSSTQCCNEDIPPVLGFGGTVTPDTDCYDSGTSLDYVCIGNLAGPPFNNCDNGGWSFGVGPTCTDDVKCPKPSLSDGSISPDQTEYELYTTITYSCDSGYTLTGSTMATCEKGGIWNPSTVPTCEDAASSCSSTQCWNEDIPPILGIGGTVTPDTDCYDSGTSIDYVCNGNLAGPPFNNCVNGGWSFGVGPTCTEDVKCPKPSLSDGSISPDQTEYELYTTITYSCNSGYTLTVSTTCENGGNWNPSTVLTCEANCAKPTLDDGTISPDKMEYLNGEVITYSCNANYTLVGITSTACRNGVYDPPNKPTCYESCNPPIVDNSDYQSQQDLVNHGTTITIECDVTYSTATGTKTDLTCSDGNFDNPAPVCYAVIPATR